MAPLDTEIRVMDEDGILTMLDWAAQEGWNPGEDDAPSYYAADPGGFLGCYLNNQLVSMVSAVQYGEAYGFLGFYICHPEFRRQGLGAVIWNAAMKRLEGRTIGLDGVVEEQDNYAKSGFRLVHQNMRYSGLSDVTMPMDQRISIIGKGILPSIIEYDRNYFPAERSAFLERWMEPMNPMRRGLYLVEEGIVRGYGVIRAARDGYRIGPMAAETPEGADLLFRALAGSAKGQMINIDLPLPNEQAVELAERYDLSPVFATARMYKGQDPNLPLDKIYSFASYELG
ncbi:Acetyltransferase (GNAT) family protein [Pseudovibrio sp. W64]|uniref:GNAT family N-acetyltransferase n=1 Tax=unclassified Pseudovibrio TaxID=2627060 RepID=UPI0007AE926C|nr:MULTISPECIES: GNAT family N-acetyltransferase [unclassified Pseudovibrio]KZK84376.1 Acetyltransferase (GNAT) family protein [Pseudovibrio sp. W64]KZK87169.1 Acetyltransferase (GNAT) family protein [Pseudovibrio sp. Ad13]KZK89189.1 Acetyltransferase (GNAT) family protein [Pseudovibrio sp. Ad5]KZK95391.1 Acetyltransferase (GNAT) family protein [Pseudovibrio sp. Ad46]